MLSGRNVIVTGAAGGIGRAMVRRFVEDGARVWACSRAPRPETTTFFEEIAADFPEAVTPVYFDLADPDAIAAGMKSIIAEKRPIHGLVNNAGMMSPSRLFTMTPLSVFREVFDVNFFSVVQITQLAIRAMGRFPDEPHSIVNISSIAALDGDVSSEYASAKAAILGLTRRLSRECAPQRIRVNAIAPGLTKTGMVADVPENVRSMILSRGIGGREATPENVADIAAFLLSDRSVQLNGQTLRADG